MMRSWIKSGNDTIDAQLSNIIHEIDSYQWKKFFKNFKHIDEFLLADPLYSIISVCNYCNIDTFQMIYDKSTSNEKYQCLTNLCIDGSDQFLIIPAIIEKIKIILADSKVIPAMFGTNRRQICELIRSTANFNLDILDVLLPSMLVTIKVFEFGHFDQGNLTMSFLRVFFKHVAINEFNARYIYTYIICPLINCSRAKSLPVLSYILDIGYKSDILSEIYVQDNLLLLDFMDKFLEMGAKVSDNFTRKCLASSLHLEKLILSNKQYIRQFFERGQLSNCRISTASIQLLHKHNVKFTINRIQELVCVPDDALYLCTINPNIIFDKNIYDNIALSSMKSDFLIKTCDVNQLWSYEVINRLIYVNYYTRTNNLFDMRPISLITDHTNCVPTTVIREIFKKTREIPPNILHKLIRQFVPDSQSECKIHDYHAKLEKLLCLYKEFSFDLDIEIDGWTPMLIAIDASLYTVVDMLIGHGADMYIVKNRLCGLSNLTRSTVTKINILDDVVLDRIKNLNFDILVNDKIYHRVHHVPFIYYLYKHQPEKTFQLINKLRYFNVNFFVGKCLKHREYFDTISYCTNINELDTCDKTLLFNFCAKIKKIKNNRVYGIQTIMNLCPNVNIKCLHTHKSQPEPKYLYPIDLLYQLKTRQPLFLYILATRPTHLPDINSAQCIQNRVILQSYIANCYFWDTPYHKYFPLTFQNSVRGLALINYRMKHQSYYMPKCIFKMIINYLEMM